jgi:hypothetical protein
MDVVTERPTARPPYHAYATITGVFVAGLALSGRIARLLGRDPREQTWLDLATLSAATFKASRTIVRDDVTSFLREPLVEGDPRDSEDEHPVQTGGMEQAIGERHVQPLRRRLGLRRPCNDAGSRRVSAACSRGRSPVRESTTSCRRASPR